MKKLFVLAAAVLTSATLVASGVIAAEKKHAPKPVWGAMVGGLNDIQNITAAMMVFDMKRAAKITDEFQARETYISKIERLPEAVRKGHANVATAVAKVAAAAKAGEEKDVTSGLAEVMDACNACHYDLRDAERRKKMK